jgi:hypothetical protein
MNPVRVPTPTEGCRRLLERVDYESRRASCRPLPGQTMGPDDTHCRVSLPPGTVRAVRGNALCAGSDHPRRSIRRALAADRHSSARPEQSWLTGIVTSACPTVGVRSASTRCGRGDNCVGAIQLKRQCLPNAKGSGRGCTSSITRHGHRCTHNTFPVSSNGFAARWALPRARGERANPDNSPRASR